jgi:hypothetical protein
MPARRRKRLSAAAEDGDLMALLEEQQDGYARGPPTEGAAIARVMHRMLVQARSSIHPGRSQCLADPRQVLLRDLLA